MDATSLERYKCFPKIFPIPLRTASSQTISEMLFLTFHSGVFIVNFEPISHIIPVIPFLALN